MVEEQLDELGLPTEVTESESSSGSYDEGSIAESDAPSPHELIGAV